MSARVTDDSWAPFEEPELLSLTGVGRGFVVGRVLIVAWSLAVLVAAIAAGRTARSGLETGETIGALGWIGLIVGILVAVAGWMWSDRVARNVHRLEARLPSRVRSASAWMWPLVCFAVLSVTFVRAGATDGFDVRPLIIVTAFAIAMWRPYALLRRVMKSISRIGIDAIVMTAYVLEVAGFGLVWWRIATWPHLMTPSNSGTADALVGAVLAASLAFSANVVLWSLMLKAVSGAMALRIIALRTRHDHRQLRLAGIDPMDPDVRFALLRVQRELAGTGDDRTDDDRTDDDRTDDDRAVEEPPVEDVDEPAPVDESVALDEVVEELGAEPVDESEPVEEPVPAEESRNPSAGLRRRLAPDADVEPDADDDVVVETQEEPVVPGREVAAAAREASEGAESSTVVGRLAERLESTSAPSAPDSPLERLSTRLGADAEPTSGSRSSLLDRLADLGINSESHGLGDETGVDLPVDERGALPQMYPFEASRYAFLLALAVATTSTMWIVRGAFAASGGLVNGEIGPSDIDTIDLARRVMVSSFGITVALIPLWCAAAAVYARRANVPDTQAGRCFAMFVMAVAANALSLIVDIERSTLSLLCLVGSLAVAFVAIRTVVPILIWFSLSTRLLSMWAGGLVVVLATSLVGQMHRPIEPTDALEALTFGAAFQSIVSALVLVLAAVATGELDEAVKLAGRRSAPDDALETEGADVVGHGR